MHVSEEDFDDSCYFIPTADHMIATIDDKGLLMKVRIVSSTFVEPMITLGLTILMSFVAFSSVRSVCESYLNKLFHSLDVFRAKRSPLLYSEVWFSEETISDLGYNHCEKSRLLSKD